MTVVSRFALVAAAAACTGIGPTVHAAETAPNPAQAQRTFIDVHVLGPGNVTAEAVAEAHQHDLAVQDRHGVSFESYWVDEAQGLVYCLATAPDAAAVTATHREAHGLLPDEVHEVTEGH